MIQCIGSMKLGRYKNIKKEYFNKVDKVFPNSRGNVHSRIRFLSGLGNESDDS